ncbi:MAG: GntR family transcriptional regulator [Phycisphaeraceae bacterium]
MATQESQVIPVSNAQRLANMIESDIRRRALVPGDAYLPAEDVARMLNVTPRTANRAMQLLAQDGVLDRRRGVGTFIGEHVKQGEPVQLRCVHVLITMQRLRTGFVADDLLAGLSQELGCDIQFNLVPAEQPLEYVRRVIDENSGDGRMVGTVLVGCPRLVQEFVGESGVPAVVFGSVYPGSERLPSIDLDHFDLGRQMARRLLERGHERLVLLTRESWLRGDNLLLDGINAEMAERGMRQGSLIVRSVPPDHEAASQEVARLMRDEPGATGWMIRGRTNTEAALATWRRAGVVLGRDIELVSDTDGAITQPSRGHSVMVTQLTYRERAIQAGRLLAERDQGAGPRHIGIAVELQEVDSEIPFGGHEGPSGSSLEAPSG